MKFDLTVALEPSPNLHVARLILTAFIFLMFTLKQHIVGVFRNRQIINQIRGNGATMKMILRNVYHSDLRTLGEGPILAVAIVVAVVVIYDVGVVAVVCVDVLLLLVLLMLFFVLLSPPPLSSSSLLLT